MAYKKLKKTAKGLKVSEKELKRLKKASPRQNKFNTPSYMTTAEKKNFKKYKPKKIKAAKSLTASQLWKFAPDVKS